VRRLKDAHEFLCQLLDQLKDDMDKINKQLALPISFANSVVDNFQFEVTHAIECKKYKNTEYFYFIKTTLALSLSRSLFSIQNKIIKNKIKNVPFGIITTTKVESFCCCCCCSNLKLLPTFY
jgi:hypothetical protein